jgi:cell division protein FtsQ
MKRPEGFDQPEPELPQRKTGRPARTARSRDAAREASPKKPPAGGTSAERTTSSPATPTPVSPDRSASAPAAASASTARHPHPAVEAKPSRAERSAAREIRRSERIESRRFTRHSRRRRLTWLGAAATIVLLGGVLAVAVFSPVLALRTVDVQGAQTISAAAVRAALNDQVGTPLALLDTAKIDRDLSRFTLIRSYVTEVVPPNTLVVRIVERQAIAVIANGNNFDQVDPAGVVLKTSATRAGLPVIDIGSAKPGGPAFTAAVKVLLAMPSSVASQVATVSATTLDDVSLTLTGNSHTVIWGSSADSEAKALTLASMLKIKQCRALPVLNVTAPLVAACGRGQQATQPTPTATP